MPAKTSNTSRKGTGEKSLWLVNFQFSTPSGYAPSELEVYTKEVYVYSEWENLVDTINQKQKERLEPGILAIKELKLVDVDLYV